MTIFALTSGEYDEFGVFAYVDGPEEPSLAILLAQFRAEFDLSTFDTYNHESEWFMELDKALQRLRDQGYEGSILPDLFVSWLVKRHGFTAIEYPQFHTWDTL